MRRKIIFSIILLLAIVSVATSFYLLTRTQPLGPLLSPLASPFSSTLPANTSKKQGVGFYPYWNLDKINAIDFSGLSDIYYFAIDVNANGSFNINDPGWAKLSDPQFERLKAKAAAAGVNLGVTLVNLDPDSIVSNVNNSATRDRLIRNTIQLMKDNNFNDLNIDLEYTGSPDDQTKKNYTAFVTSLATQVRQQIPGSKISLDAFSDSVVKPRILDLKSLSQSVDSIIIMTYDFHRLNSISAGPVAPLFGKGKYDYDVTTSVSDFITVLPAEKILLGVPFYGYEWPTLDSQKESYVIRSTRPPELSSYHRSLQTAQDHNASINFDDYSKSVWFSYYDDASGTWRQVWFENERSLGLKFDLVNQASLSGIAIFALGYDGQDSQPLWQVVKEKLLTH